jgi:hypothetical protein
MDVPDLKTIERWLTAALHFGELDDAVQLFSPC